MGTQVVEHGTTDLLIGAIFVLFYSASRFNTPATNRSSTTAGRYFTALLLYCFFATLAYVLLVNSPHLLAFFAQGSAQSLPPFLKELSSPLVMALLMTALLPKLPLLSSADEWVLQRLQGMASIPIEVGRLSAELRSQPITLCAGTQQEIRRKLMSDDFSADDIRFERGEEPAHLWTRLTALLVQLESWESDRRMTGYVQSGGKTLERIEVRYQGLIPKAKSCFRLLQQSETDGVTDKAREAIRLYAEDFAEQVTNLSHEICDFISRGILASEFTDSARRRRLAALGFTANVKENRRLTLNQLMSLFAVVAIVILSSFAMFSGSNGVTQGILLTRAIMISLIYSVAVASVVIPRQRWSFARREPGEMRPVAFYLVAGIFAVVVTQAISFGFNWVLAGSFAAGVHRYLFTYPWSVMTFTTSVITALLIDNPAPDRIPRATWRCAEGAIAACVMLGAAILTHRWLVERRESAKDLAESLGYFVPELEAILVPAGAVGFAIGYLVPAWFRKAGHAPIAVPAPLPA